VFDELRLVNSVPFQALSCLEVEEFFGTRHQSDSFSSINVGIGFHLSFFSIPSFPV
jgi:hypothetical protein